MLNRAPGAKAATTVNTTSPTFQNSAYWCGISCIQWHYTYHMGNAFTMDNPTTSMVTFHHDDFYLTIEEAAPSAAYGAMLLRGRTFDLYFTSQNGTSFNIHSVVSAQTGRACIAPGRNYNYCMQTYQYTNQVKNPKVVGQGDTWTDNTDVIVGANCCGQYLMWEYYNPK